MVATATRGTSPTTDTRERTRTLRLQVTCIVVPTKGRELAVEHNVCMMSRGQLHHVALLK